MRPSQGTTIWFRWNLRTCMQDPKWRAASRRFINLGRGKQANDAKAYCLYAGPEINFFQNIPKMLDIFRKFSIFFENLSRIPLRGFPDGLYRKFHLYEFFVLIFFKFSFFFKKFENDECISWNFKNL